MKSLVTKSITCVTLVAVMAIGGCTEEPKPTQELSINESIIPTDLLTADKYTSLTVEIATGGVVPSGKAQSHLQTFLQSLLNKPDGISIKLHDIPELDEDEEIDLEKLKSIETFRRKEKTEGKTLTVWIVFLNGKYLDENKNPVMSIPYGPSSIAVFGKSDLAFLREDMPARASLEKYILTHEFGHLLGLVGGHTPMTTPHKAEGHGNHCSNTKCLMHWDAASSLVLSDLLGDDVVPALDVDCRNDLKAAGGK